MIYVMKIINMMKKRYYFIFCYAVSDLILLQAQLIS
jgi:hypothetical protein